MAGTSPAMTAVAISGCRHDNQREPIREERNHGGAGERRAEITPPGAKALIHLAINDEEPLRQAFVVIEAR